MSRQVKDANGVWHTVAGGDALTFTGTLEEWNALTPAQQNTYSRKYITNDTTLTSDLMTGATASTNGTQGLVPAPLAGDQDKVLKGNGSWSTLPIGDLTNLTTTEKSTLVGAVNEVDEHANTNTTNIASNLNKINILIQNGNWRTGLRYKNLGTSFTADQKAMIAAGDFTELWNGDFWVINNITWRVVDNSNYYKRRGDTEFTANHLVIMPDNQLVGAEAYLIDDANDSGHGYANCAYRTRTDGKGKAQCKTLFSNAFGADHIATHRELMSTSRGAGGATGWGWQDADVELPSEVNIYGHSAWGCGLSNAAYSPGYNIGTNWGQFKLFELAPVYGFNRINCWLRDIVSASYFAYCNYNGFPNYYAPSSTWYGLRPYAFLK